MIIDGNKSAKMRMMDSSHQQPTVGSYRVVNEHTANVVVEKLSPEKVGSDDDDDDDVDLLGDGEINTRLSLCRSNNGDGTGAAHGRMEHDKRLRREIANSNERRRMQSINAGFQSLKALLPRRDGEKMSKASILQQTADFIRNLQSERDVLAHQSNELKQLLDVGALKPSRQVLDKVFTPSCIPKTEALPLDKRHCGEYGMTLDASTAPPKKRRKFENDSADEGLGMLSDAEALTIPRSSPGNHAPRSMAIPTAAAFTQTDPPCSTTEVSCCTSPIPRLLNESKGMESSVVQDKLWEIEMLQRQLIELRLALDRERRVRLMLEDQMRITELNRLQTLARLQTVPLGEYGVPQTPANAPPGHPTAGSTPPAAMRASSPNVLGQLSTTSATASAAANHCATVTTMSTIPLMATVTSAPAPRTSLHSLPDPVPLRPLPTSSEPAKPTGGDLLPLSSATASSVGCHRSFLSSSMSPPAIGSISQQPVQAVALNNAALYQSNSSKQSLAAIVEAIRHLEGDQLFVDVELHRPIAQQQSLAASAVLATATTGGPTAVSSHCHAAMVGAAMRPDYTDSGISSPVSERHLFNSAVSNFAAVGGQNVGQLVAPASNEGNVGTELNHVVAATAAALHNLCFPYTNPQHLGIASAIRHNQLQPQARPRTAGWTSAALQ